VSAYLSGEDVVGLERLGFAPRRRGLASSIASSGRRSGSGIDFADYRRYYPGDDPRHVDWSVYARTRKLVLRRFHVDADPCLYLILDGSASMGLGRPAKLAFARRLAASLAYVGWRGSHAIGLAMATDRLETYLAPSHRRDQLGRVLGSMGEEPARGTSDLGRACSELAVRGGRRGLAIVLSDFFTPAGFGEGLSALSRAGFDLAALQILSREDLAPVFQGEVEIWDVEAGETARLRVGPRSVARYRERLEEWNRSLEAECARRGALYRKLESFASISETLEDLIEAGLLERRRA
jgi:uncharacterized protein (DUF58 family)